MSLFLNENPLKHQGYELDIHKDIFHVQYFFWPKSQNWTFRKFESSPTLTQKNFWKSLKFRERVLLCMYSGCLKIRVPRRKEARKHLPRIISSTLGRSKTPPPYLTRLRNIFYTWWKIRVDLGVGTNIQCCSQFTGNNVRGHYYFLFCQTPLWSCKPNWTLVGRSRSWLCFPPSQVITKSTRYW